MLNKNPYTWLGLGLLIAGSLVSLVAQFVLVVTWLTAIGISMVILSFILLALARTIPKISPQICSLLLETGVDNMATMIEELGIRTKAVYLPSSLTNGQPKALIPLHANPSLPPIKKTLPQRLIVKYGNRPDDIGLLFSTIGSAAVDLVKTRLSPDSAELESALTFLFTGVLGVADSINVTDNENNLRVEIRNGRLENEVTCYHECMGGPLASIVASVVAEARDKLITIKQEEQVGVKHTIELEVVQ